MKLLSLRLEICLEAAKIYRLLVCSGSKFFSVPNFRSNLLYQSKAKTPTKEVRI